MNKREILASQFVEVLLTDLVADTGLGIHDDAALAANVKEICKIAVMAADALLAALYPA